MEMHDSQRAPPLVTLGQSGWNAVVGTSTEVKGEDSDMVRMLKRFLKGDNRLHIVGSWGF